MHACISEIPPSSPPVVSSPRIQRCRRSGSKLGGEGGVDILHHAGNRILPTTFDIPTAHQDVNFTSSPFVFRVSCAPFLPIPPLITRSPQGSGARGNDSRSFTLFAIEEAGRPESAKLELGYLTFSVQRISCFPKRVAHSQFFISRSFFSKQNYYHPFPSQYLVTFYLPHSKLRKL